MSEKNCILKKEEVENLEYFLNDLADRMKKQIRRKEQEARTDEELLLYVEKLVSKLEKKLIEGEKK